MGTAKLLDHQYGKERVRVLKVLRDGATHTVKELTVSVSLSGDFESSYSAGDNSKIILTDTMKNTVNSLAKKHLGLETERFSVALANHFIARYPQVQKAVVKTKERVWKRLNVWGAEHAHSFSGDQESRPVTRVSATAAGAEVSSGVEGLLILKSTGSGFEKYAKDEFTTLSETKDRVFSTSLDARWNWSGEPADYCAANRAVLDALLAPFALNYSPSVQTTLYQMGEAALEACAEISRIHLAMPNKHYLWVNLAPFGQDNANEIFLPTDEPAGQIEGTIVRA